MSKLSIPFENGHRLDLIQHFINTTNSKKYLEIGCDKNQIFSKIKCDYMVGVDPARGGTLRMTSDEFFSQNTETFDTIFIDGLHHYDQVLRDVDNSLKILNSGGTIIIHDMLPVIEEETNMPNPGKSKVWLGDVWRLGFELMSRSDIKFKLVTIDYGCGVVTKDSQEPRTLDVENSWEWYSNHWNNLPLTSIKSIL